MLPQAGVLRARAVGAASAAACDPPVVQVDFRKEARHLQEFSAYLDASGMRAVATCPYVYKALSTQRCARLRMAVTLSLLAWGVAQPAPSPSQLLCTPLCPPGDGSAGIKAATRAAKDAACQQRQG